MTMNQTQTGTRNFSSAAHRLLKAARNHQDQGFMPDSARLCADDAEALFDAGDFVASARRALHSLGYSVGLLSSVYRRGEIDLRIVVRQAGG